MFLGEFKTAVRSVITCRFGVMGQCHLGSGFSFNSIDNFYFITSLQNFSKHLFKNSSPYMGGWKDNWTYVPAELTKYFISQVLSSEDVFHLKIL